MDSANTSYASCRRRSAATAASAIRAAAHGEPLISASPSFSPRSPVSISGPKRWLRARISPEPPFPCPGTTGSCRPPSRSDATASIRRTAGGRMPAQEDSRGERARCRAPPASATVRRTKPPGKQQHAHGDDVRCRRVDHRRDRHNRSSPHRPSRQGRAISRRNASRAASATSRADTSTRTGSPRHATRSNTSSVISTREPSTTISRTYNREPQPDNAVACASVLPPDSSIS